MASSSPRQRSAANPASPQETLALVPQTQAAYPHVPLRGSRQTVKRNYAEIDLSDLEGQCDEADEQSFMPSVGQKKRGRPAKRVSRKRPTYTRPAIAKTITPVNEEDSPQAKELFNSEFYEHYRPHWGAKKRKKNNNFPLPAEIIDDSDDKDAKDALLAELFSRDITHGYTDEDERLECFLKPDKKGGVMPKRPLNVYFLYRMDIGSLVDRFARLHKEPIKVGDDLFILLKECCQLIPHFKEGIYTGNAKTLACTRRWDELKAKNPMKLKFFELLEHEYKELYSRMENFVDYHYNPNREYTPPPQLRRAGQQSPVSIDSTPARSRVDTPFDRSYTNTPYPEEEDGYVIPTNQGDANIPIVTSAGFAPSQFTFQPPSYGYNHAGGGFYEGSQYFQSQEAAALATSHYLDAPTPYLSHLAAYQFPPPGAIYPSYPTATNFFVNPASLRGDTPYSGAEFTPSPSVPPEDLAERPPTPDMYDTSVYADMRPLDFDEEVAGRRRSSAMFDRLLN